MIPPEEHPSRAGRRGRRATHPGGSCPRPCCWPTTASRSRRSWGSASPTRTSRLVTVDNGDDAIARARQERPDLILADVVMPGKSGYEVCEAIKADPSLRHIPVLLLTGTFEAFDEARAARAGAAGHVAKPFESQMLVEKVKRLLAQRRAARSAAPRPAPRAAAPPLAPPRAPAAAARTPLPPPPASGRAARPRRQLRVLQRRARGAGRAGRRAPPRSPTTPSRSTRTTPRSHSATPSSRTSSPSRRRPRGRALAAPAPGERTVAILPDEPPPPDPPGRDRPPRATAARARAADDADFAPLERARQRRQRRLRVRVRLRVAGLRPRRLLRVDSDDLAQATVLDPNGASGYDVSSSDLRDDARRARGVRRARPSPPRAEARPRSDAKPATRACPRRASTPRRVSPRGFASTRRCERQPSSRDEAEFAPLAGDDELDESSLEVLEPPRPARAAAPAPARRPPPRAGSRRRERRPAARTPWLRSSAAQLHDTLEKIAWESFSSVTEQIVRQAVERIEAIAWEVIPQMAETLIREEIRR